MIIINQFLLILTYQLNDIILIKNKLYIGNCSHPVNFGEYDARKVCYFFTKSYFHLMETNSRFYFSLCEFLVFQKL